MLAKTTSSFAIAATAALSLSGSVALAAPAAIPTHQAPAPIQKPAPRIPAQDAPHNPIGLSHTFPASSYFAKADEELIRDVNAPTLSFLDRATLFSYSPPSSASAKAAEAEDANQNSTTAPIPSPFLSTDPWRPNRQIRAQIPLSPEVDVDALRLQISGEMGNSTAAISNHDTRERWTDMSYPYSAMGRLTWEDGTWCSATLVGPRHVAAAGHCAPPAAPGKTSAESRAAVATARVRFDPQAGVSRNVEGAWVSEIVTLAEEERECEGNGDDRISSSDWAIFMLDSPLGLKYGWLGTKTLEELSSEKEKEAARVPPVGFEPTTILPDTTFYQYGYAGDKKVKGQSSAEEEEAQGAFPYRQEGISVFDTPFPAATTEADEEEAAQYWNPSGSCPGSTPLIHTDATVGTGESGGALFRGPDRRGRFYAYGVLTGSSGSNSFSAGGDEWVAAVNWARGEFA